MVADSVDKSATEVFFFLLTLQVLRIYNIRNYISVADGLLCSNRLDVKIRNPLQATQRVLVLMECTTVLKS